MNRDDVVTALKEVRAAKMKWTTRLAEFHSGVDAVLRLLLHEAAANRMSDREVAVHAGLTTKQVRARMRAAGLNPRDGKTLLSQKAAEALATNAELMGIDVREMDLMSPLAYLPMGSEMKRTLLDSRASRVTALDEDSFPETHRCSGLDILEDEDGVIWYQCPECKRAVTAQALIEFGRSR